MLSSEEELGVPTEPCHCGQPIHVYDEPGMEGFSRGLCLECSTVRCDIEPGACPVAWNSLLFDAARTIGLIDQMRRVPTIRLAYRRLQNGHQVAVARKPGHRGRRRAWGARG